MLTHEHVAHIHKQKESFRKRLEAYKERAKGATTKIVRTLEVTAGAAIGGVIQGKGTKIDPTTGKAHGPALLHVPIDLGLGLALNLAGYFNVTGDQSDHLNNLGDGFIGAYASNLGFHLGEHWRVTGHLFTNPAPTASLPPAAAAAMAAGAADPQRMAQMIGELQAAQRG
jgi:hypothetical protein